MVFPSHDCIRYFLTRLQPEQPQSAFIAWVNVIKEKIPKVDGKASKGSQKSGLGGLHMVIAWGSLKQIGIRARSYSRESNEIPALLKLLELKGNLNLQLLLPEYLKESISKKFAYIKLDKAMKKEINLPKFN